jgi:hypothetical protein
MEAILYAADFLCAAGLRAEQKAINEFGLPLLA